MPEVSTMKKRIKINGIIIFLAVIMIAVFPDLFLRQPRNIFSEALLSVFGLSFILLGQLFRVCSRGYKAENSRQSGVLLQGGPYTLVRNPMYLGIFLIGFGIILVLFKGWVSLVFLVIFILRYGLLMLAEEKKLNAVFPKEYPAYLKKSPRLFPRLSIAAKGEISGYLPLKLSWLKKEVNSIIPVLLACFAVKLWRNAGGAELAGMLIALLFFAGLAVYLKNAAAKS